MATHLAEAAKSLLLEKVQQESAFLIEMEGNSYVIHVSEFEENPLPADMSLELNKQHRLKNREVMDSSMRAEGKLIYDIKAR